MGAARKSVREWEWWQEYSVLAGGPGEVLKMALSTKQAADYLGMSVRQVARLCEEGKLKACNVEGVWSIDPVSVEYYMITPKDKGGRPRNEQ